MMNKTILIIISSLRLGGGAERVASRLSVALHSRKYRVFILTFYDSSQEYPYMGERFSRRESLTESKVLKLFRRAYHIKKLCKEKNVDTVVSFMEEANFPSIFSKYMGNKAKIISSVRTSMIFNQSYLAKIMVKILFRRADHIVTVTKRLQYMLEQAVRLRNVTTIYNPIDIPVLKQKLDEDDDRIFKGNVFVFIAIGRLGPEKGHRYLIKAFKEVVRKDQRARLVILGDGELRQALEDLVGVLGLQNHVFFLGNRRDIFPLITSSHCFVLPSLQEGFPNVLLEALSVGIPIIATDCETGPREILAPEVDINGHIKYPYFGRYGILTSPFSLKGEGENMDMLDRKIGNLADAMTDIMENIQLRRKYSNGIQRAVDFKTENIMRAWKKIL